MDSSSTDSPLPNKRKVENETSSDFLVGTIGKPISGYIKRFFGAKHDKTKKALISPLLFLGDFVILLRIHTHVMAWRLIVYQF